MNVIGAILLAAPFAALFGVPSGLIAARKGFAWYCWVLAFGLIGLVVVACLPSARHNESTDLHKARRDVGNFIGAALSLGFLASVLIMVLGR